MTKKSKSTSMCMKTPLRDGYIIQTYFENANAGCSLNNKALGVFV